MLPAIVTKVRTTMLKRRADFKFIAAPVEDLCLPSD